ncbi:MAG TPA: hypothetical protein ENK50_10705 [Sedimenticola sp.]|nr:hypothetical protein [Sedimenticola sp.]
MSRRLLPLLFLLPSLALWAAYPVEVLQLGGHPASEVIPLIERFIDKDGSVSGIDDKLVIRTSRKNLEQIRQILKRIDSPPRPLLITVWQGTGPPPASAVHSAAGGGDEPGTSPIIGLPSDPGRVKPGQIIGLPPRGEPARRGGITAATHSDRDQVQQVSVVEGKPAFIETGREVPVYDGAVVGGLAGYGAALNTRYKRATTGFYVVARILGDRVQVQVSTRQSHPDADASFDNQRAGTTLTGRPGEWLLLGGSRQGGADDRQVGGISASTTGNRDRAVYLKVEEID